MADGQQGLYRLYWKVLFRAFYYIIHFPILIFYIIYTYIFPFQNYIDMSSLSTDLIPIKNLSVEDLEPLFSAWNFDILVPILKAESVNGAMLSEVDSAEDLEDFGVVKKFRKGLFSKIQESKAAGGVSRSLFQVIFKFRFNICF